jgi:hypothetical protein
VLGQVLEIEDSMKGRSTVERKLELVPIPISDVDRAKAFYAE